MALLQGLRSLLSLLTRIPVGSQSIDRAAQYFYLVPLIGFIEGFSISLSLVILRFICECNLMVSSLYLIVHLVVVGGIHFDGFADYSDVIGSQKRGREAVSILKDPRRGTFSIVALVGNFLISVVSLNNILENSASSTNIVPHLISIYVASTESMFLTCYIGKEEPYEGMAKLFSKHSKKSGSLVKNLVTYTSLLIALQLLWRSSVLAIANVLISAATSVLVSRDADRRVGFVNGDILGFSYEISRVSALVLTALAA
ncbi:MAG: adenosylcobinamide-GDP ribazoletransferase [Sulfolobales archaeon]|nr:adenosylcobinamide-GDP ribazoletransferase [Sulfolobales archaeon]MDW8082221.1 adenosylcobinamide-GDP ribazoletransferase [Sulfolobales archaeon]